jgi:hypothetical protein
MVRAGGRRRGLARRCPVLPFHEPVLVGPPGLRPHRHFPAAKAGTTKAPLLVMKCAAGIVASPQGRGNRRSVGTPWNASVQGRTAWKPSFQFRSWRARFHPGQGTPWKASLQGRRAPPRSRSVWSASACWRCRRSLLRRETCHATAAFHKRPDWLFTQRHCPVEGRVPPPPDGNDSLGGPGSTRAKGRGGTHPSVSARRLRGREAHGGRRFAGAFRQRHPARRLAAPPLCSRAVLRPALWVADPMRFSP